MKSLKAAGVCFYCLSTGRVLGVSRRHEATKFGIAGGKVDDGETFKEAAFRETLEETGLDLTKDPIMGIFEDDCYGYLMRSYLVYTPFEENHKIIPEKYLTVEWISIKKLLEGPYKEYNTKMLKKFKLLEEL